MPGSGRRKALFVDRDGVLIEDRGVLVRSSGISVIEGAATALRRLKDAGYLIVVVSNQTAVARGLLSPTEVVALQQAVELRLGGILPGPLSAPLIDAFYFCPHHPNATVAAYRRDCGCRKPAPGLLHEAARALDIDLGESVMVGDRPSDVAAGKAAGCRTIQVLSGRHADPLIETSAGFAVIPPDLTCGSIVEAVEQILQLPLADDGLALAARRLATPPPIPTAAKPAGPA
ncbi:MAG TPA: HAD family hydrolase [Polyangia bacterium]